MSLIKFTLIFFAASLLFASCKVDKPILPGDPGYVQSTPPGGGSTTGTGSGGNGNTGNGNSANYYIKGSLNGTAFDWEATTDYKDWITNSVFVGNIDSGITTGALQAGFYSAQTNLPAINIAFGTMQVNYNTLDSAAIAKYFYSFMTTGSWSYALNNNNGQPNVKVVEILYSDANGGNYSSLGPQNNSTFNIVSITKLNTTINGVDGLVMKVTFSCTLYKGDGSGKTITLTNGESTVEMDDNLQQ